MSALTSYSTQFTRAQRYLPSRDISARLHSKKALERRLILPIESGHWTRAFEVLNAKYARQGRNASHVEQVLNCMVKNVHPHNAGSLVPVLDGVRDQLFEGTLPQSSSLWATIALSYCSLGASQEAVETVGQWQQRSGTPGNGTAPHSHHHQQQQQSRDSNSLRSQTPPPPSRNKMKQFVNEFQAKMVCKALFPLLAREGQVEAMKSVASQLFRSPESFLSDRAIQEYTRQGHAVSGDWQASLECLARQQRQQRSCGAQLGEVLLDDENTVGALRGLCRAGKWELALNWFREEYPPLASSSSSSSASVSREWWEDATFTQRRREVMECLTTHAPPATRRHLAHRFFEEHGKVLTQTGEGDGSDFLVDRSMLTMFLHCLEREMMMQPFRTTSTEDAELPSPVVNSTKVAAAATPSSAALTLLDSLSFHCDNFAMDNIAGATFLRALLLEGKWERALHIAGATPVLKGLARQKEPEPVATKTNAGDDIAAAFAAGGQNAHKKLLKSIETQSERRVVAMLYALHGRYGNDAKQFTLAKYPFAFPQEVFRPDGIAAKLLAEYSSSTAVAAGVGAEDRHRLTPLTLSSKSTVGLTERSDRVMKHQLLRLEQIRRDDEVMSFHHNNHSRKGDSKHYVNNPQKDPRVPPIGRNDESNGWTFSGRAGLPMFANSTHAHMLSSYPKHMPAKKNPMRSWNPQMNSALGHRGNVRKWNGRSAV
ncbi:Hypothetical protein, putative [Bodo saltans]|uniref:Uncharacterized protein n=1 Tax=Bodo saltans TaxID=75058 RepID=A0A0S4INE2_BODSA|nr:Hypothetical protein, putative [Bodo saltans]|eukprot:CUE81729.1 Hypothetical protein, putative [Bodo saltans]